MQPSRYQSLLLTVIAVELAVLCLSSLGITSRIDAIQRHGVWVTGTIDSSGARHAAGATHDVQKGADAATIARRLGEVAETITYLIDRAVERGTLH